MDAYSAKLISLKLHHQKRIIVSLASLCVITSEPKCIQITAKFAHNCMKVLLYCAVLYCPELRKLQFNDKQQSEPYFK